MTTSYENLPFIGLAHTAVKNRHALTSVLSAVWRVTQPRSDAVLLIGRINTKERLDSLFAESGITCPPQIASSVPTRQSEFLAGRVLARTALDILDQPLRDIPQRTDMAPEWPAGSVGSLSHGHGLCACYALKGQDVSAGIDVETVPTGSTLRAVIDQCLTHSDASLVDRHPDLPTEIVAGLVFSAKETLFKLLYPSVQRFLGFETSCLLVQPTQGNLKLGLTRDLSPDWPQGTAFDIRYALGDGLILTWGIASRPPANAN